MLSPEERLVVARECDPSTDWRIWRWEPERSLTHRDALTRTCAQLIEKMDRDNLGAMMCFNEYLATNNIHDIEKLVFELLGDEG
jgi:hypothetical protein